MFGYHCRARRGGCTSPAEAMSHREPFSARPPRPRNGSAVPRRGSKYGSENVPPEDENVRANMPADGGYSSAPINKAAGRSRSAGPALPPRPPASRPSPAKRKLTVECQPELAGRAPDKAAAPDTGVKVIIRMRPMRMEDHEVTQIAHMLSPDTVAVVDQQFTFDAVAGMDATQKDVFDMVGLPLVENCMAGFNSSIFAYGQTGSGKTYTMWGPTNDSTGDHFPNKDRGLTPRVFEQLFARIQEEECKNVDKQLRYHCRCSFLEIYNEQITDLLEPNQRNLQIREDTKTGVYVENLTEEYVSSVDDVNQLALQGLANRRVGATSMNAESSRSHSVFTFVLESRCKSTADGLSSLKTSRINLVDLAGSERQKLTGASGERLREAGNINRSLSQLGNLIKILAEVSQTGKQRHIPYRDSRLTFLLQDSLGGNAKLAMICAISPASSCRSETLSALRFAQRAKAIKNKAVVNEETENDVNLLRDQIRQLKDELMRMKSKDNSQPVNNGGYSTSWNARRSYNLLKMSLKCPLILPHTDTDSDEEMEIDEDAVERFSVDTAIRSTDDDEPTKDSRTSSSSEKEEIQTDLDSFQRENLEYSARMKSHSDYVSLLEKDLVVDSKELAEIASEASPARDVEIGNKQTETTGSCWIEGASDVQGCENIDIQRSAVSCQEASEEDILLTSRMEGCELSKENKGTSEEMVSNCAILGVHSEVHTDRLLLIHELGVDSQNTLCRCDKDDKGDMPTTKKLRTLASNDDTKPASNASVIENDVLEGTPPSIIVPCELSPVLQSPTLSVSPRVPDGRRSVSKSFCKSTLSPLDENGISNLCHQSLSVSFAPSVRKSSHVRSDKICASPMDHLAASLQRGLQSFGRHEQNSAARKSSERFSFQTLNLKLPLCPIEKFDRSTQTSPKKVSCAETSSILELLRASCGSPDNIAKTSLEHEDDMQDKSQWELMHLEETKGHARPKHQLSQAVEGVLAGSIRREMALEEVCKNQAAEIEHLNRLVRQYKHERECNSIIQQTREDKIGRLEGLMDGAITTEGFLNDELTSLALEHKLLKDKYENHPEVTRANIEAKRLLEELEKYRNFYELGERDALMEEIQHLRMQLQYYLDSNASPISAGKLQLSAMAQAMQKSELPESVNSLGLCTISEAPVADSNEINETISSKKCDKNRQWNSLVNELRAELDSYRQLAEKRKKEVENEQRCSEELKEALQMAMEGHARILEQYAELQEKHIGLMAKHRKIREGVADVKWATVQGGAKDAESDFIKAQAAELMALKLDKEEECQKMKDEINGLQAQLRDTVEAVQAAGELLVRLKEAEEAVSTVQDAAAVIEQEAEALRRDMEKLKRGHATEMATLNQRLLESRLQKSAVCPMCQVAERVKFEFPDADDVVLGTESATKDAQDEWRAELEEPLSPQLEEHNEFLRMDQPSWFSGEDRCNI